MLRLRVTMACHARWGERSVCFPSFAPLRLRYSASCASSSNGCHALRTPFPPMNVFFSVRVLRPCVRVHPRLARSHVLPPSFADGERLILFPSVAPCVRFRQRFTLSHRLRRWLLPPSLAAPLPTHKHFFSFRALRPCVRFRQRLAQVPAMAVTLCGPPSHPITFFFPFEFCALASALFRVLRKFQQWLSRLADWGCHRGTRQ